MYCEVWGLTGDRRVVALEVVGLAPALLEPAVGLPEWRWMIGGWWWGGV